MAVGPVILGEGTRYFSQHCLEHYVDFGEETTDTGL